MVKIGTATDVGRRMASLQTASPVPLKLLGVMKGGAPLEQQIHEQFRDLRVRGEWYRLTDELRDLIRTRRDSSLLLEAMIFQCDKCGTILEEPQDSVLFTLEGFRIRQPTSCYIEQGGCSRDASETSFTAITARTLGGDVPL